MQFIFGKVSPVSFLGFRGEEPVDLKITCPEQSTVPGYSKTPLPLTTVTTTGTATTVTTTTIKSEELDSGAATVVVTTVTIKSNGSNLGFAADLGDKKALGDTILILLSFPCLRLAMM